MLQHLNSGIVTEGLLDRLACCSFPGCLNAAIVSYDSLNFHEARHNGGASHALLLRDLHHASKCDASNSGILSSENVSVIPNHQILSTFEVSSGQRRLQSNNKRITAPEALARQHLARQGQPYFHHDAEASHICSHKHSLMVPLEAPSPQSPAAIPAAQQAKSNISAAALAAAGATLQPIKCSSRMIDRSTAAVHIEAQYALPPLLLFDLLADPTQHAAIFDSIEAADAELLSASGNQKHWRLDYKARWRFWKWSGVCENKMQLWTDRDSGTVVFKLREPGFLRQYEGKWTIKALETSSSSGGSNSSSSAIAAAGGGQSELSLHSTPNNSSTLGKYTAAAVMLPLNLPFAFVRPMAPRSSSSSGSQHRSANNGYKGHASLWDYVHSLTQPIYDMQDNFSSSSSGNGGSGSSKMSSNDAVALEAGSNAASNSKPSGADFGAWFSSVNGGSARQREPLQNRPAAAAAVITVQSTTSVKLAPPPPLNKILKGQIQGMVEDMLHGLVYAAAVKQQQQQQR